jgi:hypothetical protein
MSNFLIHCDELEGDQLSFTDQHYMVEKSIENDDINTFRELLMKDFFYDQQELVGLVYHKNTQDPGNNPFIRALEEFQHNDMVDLIIDYHCDFHEFNKHQIETTQKDLNEMIIDC